MSTISTLVDRVHMYPGTRYRVPGVPGNTGYPVCRRRGHRDCVLLVLRRDKDLPGYNSVMNANTVTRQLTRLPGIPVNTGLLGSGTRGTGYRVPGYRVPG
eukprot:3645338-Rhodomonas_salina.1